ncbi:YdcF family protein [Polynucleobacter paneuropaeus]|nr:YdcF family protein [Polynucleobacter paneuropaeus]
MQINLPFVFSAKQKKNLKLRKTRDAITKFLFIKDSPTKVDFAFVLGSPTLSSIEPAIELYLCNKTTWIVVSGHGPVLQGNVLTEAELFKNYAISRGVPDSRILIETRSTNTRENFEFTYDLIESQFGWKNIGKVSISGKPFHMRRAFMTACTYWPSDLMLTMLPSDHPDDPPAKTWWQTEGGRRLVLRELEAVGEYTLSGDLSII